MAISEEKGQLEISESESETYDSDDSEKDPTFSIEKTQSKFSKLSINKNTKPIKIKEMDEEETDVEEIIIVPELDEKDQKSFEAVEKIIEAGQAEKLKVDQCKVYLRKHGLRLTGNKDILLERIKEHIDIVKSGGQNKYPVSSFVVNCKGDACTGDVVMFEQNVYEMFSIASRSATGPPCGTRVVAGRIVKESYGAAKQQHTFTIEVLWSKGEKPLPPLHPLLIKGRNLYRLKTMRQRWEDEGERQKQLMEKHTRGSVARSNREARIHEKETRKMLKTNRVPRPDNQIGKQEGKTKTSQSLHPISLGNPKIPPSSKAPPHNTPTLFPNANMPLERVHQMPPLTSMNHNPHGYQQNINSNMPLAYMNYNPRGYTQNINSNVAFERVHQRQPLTSLNNSIPSSSLYQGQGHERKQLCRFYAQGRCHYGDRCKYLHENIIIQNHGSERKNQHSHSNLRHYH